MDFQTRGLKLFQAKAEGRGLKLFWTKGLENPFLTKPTFSNFIYSLLMYYMKKNSSN